MEANSTFEFHSLLKPIKTGRQDPTKDHGELGDPLSPMARLFHRPGSSLYIMGLLGSKTSIDPHRFKAGVASAFLAYPRFSSLLVAEKKETFSGHGSAKMRWVKTEVDIDQHVFFPKIEPKDTSDVGVDKFVEEYTRDLTGIPLDMSKPLWDVHVLNLDKMTSHGAMAVALFRFHHSIGDGTSLMSLFMSFAHKESDPNAKPSLPVFTKKIQRTDPMSKTGRCLSFLRVLWYTLVDVLNLLATAFFLDDTPNPLKGPKDARQKPRRIIIKSVRLDDIKLVKNITKTTLNDVVVGVVESGVSRYLNRKYDEINQEGNKTKKNVRNLPRKLRFRATMYFNIRAVRGIQAVENMINKKSLARWGNQLGYVIYPFKIMLCDNNPLDYVYRAQTIMQRKKASLESYFSYHIGRLFLNAFGFNVASLPPVTPTMWFSNMMGPQEEISIFGYPVAYLGCSCFGQNVALMIHVMSYANSLNFILSTDDDVISNPHELSNDIEQSLKIIKMAAIAKKKSDESKD